MVKFYLTENFSQTKKMGKLFAGKVLKQGPGKRAFILGLIGDLGGGKTAFLQGFAKGLGIKEKILSPTFIILKKFKIQGRKFKNFYHIDCYRVRKFKEISALDWEKIASVPENIIAVEWADKIKKELPKNALVLKFYFIGKNIRKIAVGANSGAGKMK